MEYTIDAQGKKLGRVATEVATILMGKNTPDFAKNKVAEVTVTVINSDKLDIPLKKETQKIYTRYSGYPGGLKKETLSEVLSKKGTSEVLRRAVYGMLPKNRLQAQRIKRLTIKS